MITRDITINNKVIQGVEIPLSNTSLILAAAPKGYVMCGYLNLDAAEIFGDCAAIVKGIKNLDDLLTGKVVAVTSAASKAGIEVGMTGRDALSKMV